MAEVILGFLTFTGSLMAAGKLMEIIPTRPITFRSQNAINFSLFGRRDPGRRAGWSLHPTSVVPVPADLAACRWPSACC